jgi:hypothetical protein
MLETPLLARKPKMTGQSGIEVLNIRLRIAIVHFPVNPNSQNHLLFLIRKTSSLPLIAVPVMLAGVHFTFPNCPLRSQFPSMF